MLSWLRGKTRAERRDTGGSPLNDALIAYVHTYPAPERLQAHLESVGLADQFTQIKDLLDSAIGDTGQYLYDQATPIKWTENFERALFEHLVSRHPWLSTAGFAPLKSYAGWYSWHEGLGAL